MSKVTIRIPTPLRSYTGGAAEVPAQGETVGEALQSLGRDHKGILERVLDERGQLRSFVSVFVEDRDVRTLDGLQSRIPDGSVITIVPAVAGGWTRG